MALRLSFWGCEQRELLTHKKPTGSLYPRNHRSLPHVKLGWRKHSFAVASAKSRWLVYLSCYFSFPLLLLLLKGWNLFTTNYRKAGLPKFPVLQASAGLGNLFIIVEKVFLLVTQKSRIMYEVWGVSDEPWQLIPFGPLRSVLNDEWFNFIVLWFKNVALVNWHDDGKYVTFAIAIVYLSIIIKTAWGELSASWVLSISDNLHLSWKM